MGFKKGNFKSSEPSRKAIRETYRKAFFADLGVTPARDVMPNDIDMAAMAQSRADALATARALHEDETDALDMMEAELARLGLGQVPMPPGKRTTPNFKALSVANLARGFFYTYRG